jgi:hypothetical protein
MPVRVNYLNKADRSDPLNERRVLSIVVGRRYAVITWRWALAMPSVRFGRLDASIWG